MATYEDWGSFSLEYGWPYGDHTWKPGMDANLFKMTASMNSVVVSRSTWPLPSGSAIGTVFIIPPGATDPGADYLPPLNGAPLDGEVEDWVGRIAVCKGGNVWGVFSAQVGMRAVSLDEEIVISYTEGTWMRIGWVGSAPPPNDRLDLFAYVPLAETPGILWGRVTAGSIEVTGTGAAHCSEAPSTAFSVKIMRNRESDGDVAQIGTVSFGAGNNAGSVSVSVTSLSDGDLLYLMSDDGSDFAGMGVTLNARRTWDVS